MLEMGGVVVVILVVNANRRIIVIFLTSSCLDATIVTAFESATIELCGAAIDSSKNSTIQNSMVIEFSIFPIFCLDSSWMP